MKSSRNCFLFISIVLVTLLFGCKNTKVSKPSFTSEHKKNEAIVFFSNLEFKKNLSDSLEKLLTIENKGVLPKITKKPCSNCLELSELWTAEGLDSLLIRIMNGHGDRIATADRSTQGVNDGYAVFGLNFLTSMPETLKEEKTIGKFIIPKDISFSESGNNFIVGILDSGVDLNIFPLEFLFLNSIDDACFKNERYGWNFVNNSSDITDGTISKHGTLVNAYILEQFLNEGKIRPKLLNVKVLDNLNSGTCFDLLCGILYAKEKGAKIINASMGFYDNTEYTNKTDYKNSIFYMLLEEHLLPNEILLVTAAGNIGSSTGNSRNLAQNRFYPAYMSETNVNRPNNVVTATTINPNLEEVSPRQNYSPKHVDVGVVSDSIEGEIYKFDYPFFYQNSGGVQPFTTGSSFANAIMTGKIGAKFDFRLSYMFKNSPKSEWSEKFLDLGIYQQDSPNQLSGFIYKGRYSHRRDE
ncbi:Subtilisin-like serine proteases [Aquiflexum balticum DSM 16537]|uniref:Subtilisin-like serine proteases n=1 Tax=Aquiflexum balticum DSM 16537 TaxID=758820 RepID=A0A1W2H5A0_9BACT|nr:S8 family serine peptidase [Aquiflexum balticum]SMD44137.1 Subtilisin-like serine proteases [Aquiflexum balticum DSM 16537]